ncbi:alpha/beta fold hydrolase [Salipiger sp.]|uniref:alpha/beta fold hydrolase n=1 Tax=Salipiger sp. TaxID=2078585 RepID=UPI003A97E5CB
MHHFTTSDGLKLAYYSDDSTPPWVKADTIVLLHPAMGSAQRYFAWVPELSRHYRVLRMDMRGHGASELPGPDVPLTVERLMADVLEMLDAAGCDAAHLAGNSAGGYLAQHLAMDKPERVRSIMLFASTPGLRNSQWSSWLPEVQKVGLRAFLASNLAERLPVDRMLPDHVEWFLDEADNLDLEFGGRFVSLMSGLDWSERLPGITMPTLIVQPGIVGIGSTSQYEDMEKLIPGAQRIVYDGLPHHVCDAVPDRCVADILAFLRWNFGQPPAKRA